MPSNSTADLRVLQMNLPLNLWGGYGGKVPFVIARAYQEICCERIRGEFALP